MDACLEIELIRDEPSLIRAKASNGVFAGYSETYVNSSWVVQFGRELQGFPHDRFQEVAFESKPGMGSASSIYFRAFCIDGLGRCFLEISLKNDRWDKNPDSAHFFLQFEPAAPDQFVAELLNFENGIGSMAKLRGVTKNA